jgi:uncharacterized Fe-S center protein
MARQDCFDWVEQQHGPLNGRHPLEVVNHRDPYWLVNAAAREGLGSLEYQLVIIEGQINRSIAAVG